MRMMSIQALAMQRIRDSVTTLSRETGFRERSVEQFSQVPLYIPEYQRWSMSLQSIVGTAPPTQPKFLTNTRAGSWIEQKVATAMKSGTEIKTASLLKEVARMGSDPRWGIVKEDPELMKVAKYLEEYVSWQASQRTLPT